jgi:hypothetical protein
VGLPQKRSAAAMAGLQTDHQGAVVVTVQSIETTISVRSATT